MILEDHELDALAFMARTGKSFEEALTALPLRSVREALRQRGITFPRNARPRTNIGALAREYWPDETRTKKGMNRVVSRIKKRVANGMHPIEAAKLPPMSPRESAQQRYANRS